jgi:hypothetical protein
VLGEVRKIVGQVLADEDHREVGPKLRKHAQHGRLAAALRSADRDVRDA